MPDSTSQAAPSASHGMETVLVLGANSHIARAICHELADPSTRFILVARNEDELQRTAADLAIRHGCETVAMTFDAQDFGAHPDHVEDWCARSGGAPGGVLVCYGHLPPGELAATDAAAARLAVDVNFTSVVSLLTLLAERMESGSWIVGISSVAGDRGRQSNYVYGAAKSGLNVYLQGLRNRLAPRGVHVLTVKPGFVDTPMLRGRMEGGSSLIATPERVAKAVVRALRRRANSIYTPWFWRYVMLVVRSIPEPIFKRMKL